MVPRAPSDHGPGHAEASYRGWFVLKTGEDMELNGARPDVLVWPGPCEMPQGVDRQLDKAVAVLQAEVKKWNQRPQPKLKKASERPEI